MTNLIKRLLLAFVIMSLLINSITVFAANNEADINGDGLVNIIDVVAMKIAIANSKATVAGKDVDAVKSGYYGAYNATDLSNLISYILGKSDSFTKSNGPECLDDF